MSVNPWNETMPHAITEVQARIRAVYPDATFRLVEGEDPIGLYLDRIGNCIFESPEVPIAQGQVRWMRVPQ